MTLKGRCPTSRVSGTDIFATAEVGDGASADFVDMHGGRRRCFKKVCSNGLLHEVQRAIHHLPPEELNHQDEYGRTALYHALFTNHGDVGVILLAHGASVDTVDRYGRTPLMMACMNGLLDMVNRVVQQLPAERVNHQDRNGQTALYYALTRSHGDVGAFLLDHGASADTVNGDGRTPLMTACSDGLLGVVQRAIQQLPAERVNHQDQDGRTALHHAVGQRHGDVAAFLLAHGALADTVDTHGKTPLMTACSRGQLDVVTLLMPHMTTGRVNHQDQRGRTALYYAVDGSHGDVGAFLLAHGALADTVNRYGKTPLMTACSHGQLGVVTLLMPHMTTGRVNHQDQHGRTALHYAVDGSHGDVGAFLLTHGASVDIVDVHGGTPLMAACSKGLLRVVKRAMKQLPVERVNHKDQFGRTALHHAVNSDKGEVAKALLYVGADPTIMRNDGMTPSMIAEENGRSTCITVLQVSTCIHTLACFPNVKWSLPYTFGEIHVVAMGSLLGDLTQRRRP
jgi:ankyrin repeat protein